ncbi:MAG: efflux RND transporter periplasmic adaptor subunit [Gemmatimonadaceae bacterium]
MSAVATAQTNMQVTAINLADATVLAPMAGTVIDKQVSLGQVIASATNVVGGGTTLVTIADLGKVLDSALVNESDIGRIKVGQDVSVSVSAFPNQTFHGTVTRISPEAIVQQSVTMLPVLVSLDNTARLWLPGMNSDATIGISRLVGAVTVPNDAIASVAEARTLGAELSASPASDSGSAPGSGRGARNSARGRRGSADGTVAFARAGKAPRRRMAHFTAASSSCRTQQRSGSQRGRLR